MTDCKTKFDPTLARPENKSLSLHRAQVAHGTLRHSAGQELVKVLVSVLWKQFTKQS